MLIKNQRPAEDEALPLVNPDKPKRFGENESGAGKRFNWGGPGRKFSPSPKRFTLLANGRSGCCATRWLAALGAPLALERFGWRAEKISV